MAAYAISEHDHVSPVTNTLGVSSGYSKQSTSAFSTTQPIFHQLRAHACSIRSVAILGLLLSFVSPASGQVKNPVKLVGDETLLDTVKADPKAFIGKPFVMTGGAKVSDYFNYGYDSAEESHYSFIFLQALTGGKVGSDCHLYLRRAVGKDIVEKVLSKTAATEAYMRIRVKVTIADRRYEQGGWDLFELLDVQFASDDGSKWGLWAIEEQLEKARKAAVAQEERQMAAQKTAVEEELRAEKERRAARTRTWKDATGRFSVTAEFNGIIGDQVLLKKHDGAALRVPLTSLSQEDRDWLAERRRKK